VNTAEGTLLTGIQGRWSVCREEVLGYPNRIRLIRVDNPVWRDRGYGNTDHTDEDTDEDTENKERRRILLGARESPKMA
jgi:hypothetical protein